MLLGTLGASLLGNLLPGKGLIATSQGREQLEPVREQLAQVTNWIAAPSLTNFEINNIVKVLT